MKADSPFVGHLRAGGGERQNEGGEHINLSKVFSSPRDDDGQEAGIAYVQTIPTYEKLATTFMPYHIVHHEIEILVLTSQRLKKKGKTSTMSTWTSIWRGD